MKIIFFLWIIVIESCSSQQSDKPGNVIQPTSLKKEYPSFTETDIVPDTNIINTAGKKITLLYNSVANFPGRSDSIIYFSTECMMCEPIETFNNHLIFARQLEIFDDKATYNPKELVLPPTSKFISRVGSWDRKKRNRFKFEGGKGEISYIEPSCNDADIYEITLSYPSGKIKINNLLNAQFFEYDLNKDGNKEQYFISTRNCSQEIALLKIK
jgi:hypothetical protein